MVTADEVAVLADVTELVGFSDGSSLQSPESAASAEEASGLRAAVVEAAEAALDVMVCSVAGRLLELKEATGPITVAVVAAAAVEDTACEERASVVAAALAVAEEPEMAASAAASSALEEPGRSI